MLGWRLVSSSPEWVTLAPPDGVAYLAFQTSAGYRGATLAAHQPQPRVRVLLDPAGHPFCLYSDG